MLDRPYRPAAHFWFPSLSAVDPAAQKKPAALHLPAHALVAYSPLAAPNDPAAHFWLGRSGALDPAAQK